VAIDKVQNLSELHNNPKFIPNPMAGDNLTRNYAGEGGGFLPE
jgi:hypothetical protein